MKRTATIFFLAGLIAAGCAGRTAQRRESYLALHPNLPPETAGQIRRGEVRTGMTRADVLAAWGDPNHFIPGYSDASVVLETWVYRYHLVFGTGYYRLEFRDGILQQMVREYY